MLPCVPGVLSCFYYLGEGSRCQTHCPGPAVLFCATHLELAYRRTAADLFAEAAECVLACTELTEGGLPRIACKDFDKWGRLCNCLTALTLHGYRDDDDLLARLLTSILSLRSPWNALPKGRTLEILVARLYLEELTPLIRATRDGVPLAPDAKTIRVLWNQQLPGLKSGDESQIDVVIQWHLGPLGSIVTAVECKDREVRRTDVDAFATRLQDIGAHNGVLVSSVGFQSGAMSTARAFDVELRLVREADLTPQKVERSIDRYRMVPKGVFLEPPSDRGHSLVRTPPREIRIIGADGTDLGTAESLLKDVLDSELPIDGAWPPAKERPTPGATLAFPDGRREPLAKVHMPLALTKVLERTILEQPRRPQMFHIQDVLSGAKRHVPARTVPLLTPPTLLAGGFYTNLMSQRYFCKSVEGDDATLILLADRQHGRTLDVEMVQSLEYAHSYYPIEDPVALGRLTADLERYKKLPGQENAP